MTNPLDATGSVLDQPQLDEELLGAAQTDLMSRMEQRRQDPNYRPGSISPRDIALMSIDVEPTAEEEEVPRIGAFEADQETSLLETAYSDVSPTTGIVQAVTDRIGLEGEAEEAGLDGGNLDEIINPIDANRGTIFEPYPSVFVDAVTTRELLTRRRQFRRNIENRLRMTQFSTGANIAAGLFASVVDPTSLLAYGGAIRAVNQATRLAGGAGVVRWAEATRQGRLFSTVAGGALAATIDTAIWDAGLLQGEQPLYTNSELEFAFTLAPIVGGALGGALGGIGSYVRRRNFRRTEGRELEAFQQDPTILGRMNPEDAETLVQRVVQQQPGARDAIMRMTRDVLNRQTQGVDLTRDMLDQIFGVNRSAAVRRLEGIERALGRADARAAPEPPAQRVESNEFFDRMHAEAFEARIEAMFLRNRRPATADERAEADLDAQVAAFTRSAVASRFASMSGRSLGDVIAEFDRMGPTVESPIKATRRFRAAHSRSVRRIRNAERAVRGLTRRQRRNSRDYSETIAQFRKRLADERAAQRQARADYRSVMDSVRMARGIEDGKLGGYQTPGRIMLLEDADVSTLSHEVGHWMLDILARLRQFGGDSAEFQRFMGDLVEVLNDIAPEGLTVRSLDDVLERSNPLVRELHERFAESFQRYLIEGPRAFDNPKHRSVFEWLRSVYQTVLRSLERGDFLTDKMRTWFDDVFAGDRGARSVEEIADPDAPRPLYALNRDAVMADREGAEDAMAEHLLSRYQPPADQTPLNQFRRDRPRPPQDGLEPLRAARLGATREDGGQARTHDDTSRPTLGEEQMGPRWASWADGRPITIRVAEDGDTIHVSVESGAERLGSLTARRRGEDYEVASMAAERDLQRLLRDQAQEAIYAREAVPIDPRFLGQTPERVERRFALDGRRLVDERAVPFFQDRRAAPTQFKRLTPTRVQAEERRIVDLLDTEIDSNEGWREKFLEPAPNQPEGPLEGNLSRIERVETSIYTPGKVAYYEITALANKRLFKSNQVVTHFADNPKVVQGWTVPSLKSHVLSVIDAAIVARKNGVRFLDIGGGYPELGKKLFVSIRKYQAVIAVSRVISPYGGKLFDKGSILGEIKGGGRGEPYFIPLENFDVDQDWAAIVKNADFDDLMIRREPIDPAEAAPPAEPPQPPRPPEPEPEPQPERAPPPDSAEDIQAEAERAARAVIDMVERGEQVTNRTEVPLDDGPFARMRLDFDSDSAVGRFVQDFEPPRRSVVEGGETVDEAAMNQVRQAEGDDFAYQSGGMFARALRAITPSLGVPLARIMRARSRTAKFVMYNLVENYVASKAVDDGKVGAAVETRARGMAEKYEGLAIQLGHKYFGVYRQRGGKMKRVDFDQEVARAMRRNDEHEPREGGEIIPEVTQYAKELRARVFKPLADDAIELGLLDPSVPLKGAVSYFTRRWDREAIVDRRGEFKAKLVDHFMSGLRDERSKARRYQKKLDEARGYMAQVQAHIDGVDLGEGQAPVGPLRSTIARQMHQKNEVAALEADLAAREAVLRDRESAFRNAVALRERLKQEGVEQTDPRWADMERARRRGAANRERARRWVAADRARLDQSRVRLSLLDDVLARQRSLRKLTTQAERLQKRIDKIDVATMDDTQLRDAAAEAAENVTTTLEGVNISRTDGPSWLVKVETGRLKDRTLNVRDIDFEDFLSDDLIYVIGSYARDMSADIELTRTFGRADMRDTLKSVTDEYGALIDAAPNERARQSLANERERTISDLRDARDLLRGDRQNFDSKTQTINAAIRNSKAMFYAASLGGVTPSSFPDLGRAMAVHGFRGFFGNFDHLGRLLSNPEYRQAARDNNYAAGIMEVQHDSRTAAIVGIDDPLMRQDGWTGFFDRMSKLGSRLSLINHWNQFLKGSAVHLFNARLYRLRETPFDQLAQHDRLYLSTLKIGRQLWDQVRAELSQHAQRRGDYLDPNTNAWTDRDAARLYHASARADAQSVIVTPGLGDIPMAGRRHALSLFMTLKSFFLSAHQRALLRGAHESQARYFSAMMMMITIGMGVYLMKTWSGNREPSSNWGHWIAEGFDRSGVLPLHMELNNMQEKLTNFGVYGALSGGASLFGAPEEDGRASRYAERDLLGALSGPLGDQISGGGRVIGDLLARGDITPGTIDAVRRNTPYATNWFFQPFLSRFIEPGFDALAEN